jgi:hypothetical protein
VSMCPSTCLPIPVPTGFQRIPKCLCVPAPLYPRSVGNRRWKSKDLPPAPTGGKAQQHVRKSKHVKCIKVFVSHSYRQQCYRFYQTAHESAAHFDDSVPATGNPPPGLAALDKVPNCQALIFDSTVAPSCGSFLRGKAMGGQPREDAPAA